MSVGDTMPQHLSIRRPSPLPPAQKTSEYYLTATVDLKANDAWKIRADNGWASQFNASSVEGEFEEAGSDDNFKVSKDGSYIIKLYFNKIKAKLIVMEE